MTGLQSRWYDFLVEHLMLDRAMFQIFQPAGPIAPTDAALWEVENIVPPNALTFNRTVQEAARFSDQYAAILNQLSSPAPPPLAQAIGTDTERAWSEYLGTLSPRPAAAQLAALFQNWAARHAMGAMSAGVAYLSRAVLAEPRPPLHLCRGTDARPSDFVGGYDDLMAVLRVSPQGGGFFDSAKVSADIGDSSGRTGDAGLDGLWTASGGGKPSRKFAASHVTIEVALQAFTVWTVTPGTWYSSSRLNDAFSSDASPPWRADARPCRKDFFAPGGRLRHALASLVVAEGIALTITSDAGFDAGDQKMILKHAFDGLWPLYAAGPGVRTEVMFATDGAMKAEIMIAAGEPVALGGNVLGIAQYLGHTTG